MSKYCVYALTHFKRLQTNILTIPHRFVVLPKFKGQIGCKVLCFMLDVQASLAGESIYGKMKKPPVSNRGSQKLLYRGAISRYSTQESLSTLNQ